MAGSIFRISQLDFANLVLAIRLLHEVRKIRMDNSIGIAFASESFPNFGDNVRDKHCLADCDATELRCFNALREDCSVVGKDCGN